MKATLLSDHEGTDVAKAGTVLTNYKFARSLVLQKRAKFTGKPGEIQLLKETAIIVARPQGTVIDHPDAWKLVRTGSAAPADEECRIMAGMTDAEIALAAETQKEMQQGIGRYLAAEEYAELNEDHDD